MVSNLGSGLHRAWSGLGAWAGDVSGCTDSRRSIKNMGRIGPLPLPPNGTLGCSTPNTILPGLKLYGQLFWSNSDFYLKTNQTDAYPSGLIL